MTDEETSPTAEPARANKKAMGRLGGGWYVNPLAKAGRERMAQVLADDYKINASLYKFDLDRIANDYLADQKHDASISLSDMKSEAEKIKTLVEPLVLALKRLSAPLRFRLSQKVALCPDVEFQRTTMLLDCLHSMVDAIDDIEEVKGTKVGNISISILCERLMRLRERVTGKPFRKSKDAQLDELNNETGHFKQADPEFVLRLAQALDPSIRLRQVRSCFISKGKCQGKKDGLEEQY